MGTTVNAAVNAGGSAPPATPAPTPAVTTAAPPKVSWLKHVGQFLGKVLGIVAKDAKPIADTAATVTEALYPQFAPEISAADNLVTNIAKEALDAEVAAAAAGSQNSGPAKLNAVLANVGPAVDDWVAAKFPGAKQVSAASKAGLVNAVVAIMNEVEGAPIA